MNQLRNALMTLLTVALLVAMYQFVYVPILREEADFEICGDKHYLRMCYNIQKSACQAIWNSSQQICFDRHLAKLRKERPGALAGPVTQQCREYEFNKVSKFMVSSSSDEACLGLRQRIKAYEAPESP